MKDWVGASRSLTGKVAVVTGANTGLGFEIALQLSKRGAHVVLACRSVERGLEAAQRIANLTNQPSDLSVARLDLVSLEAVASFANQLVATYDRLDLLINNAGAINLPTRELTEAGYERQMATNHFGHFALVGLFMPLIAITPGARVVTMSSELYRLGVIEFNDLDWARRPYKKMRAYGDSKFANLLFTMELERYFRRVGIDAKSVAAHPGLAKTERHMRNSATGKVGKLFAQTVQAGALPALRAALDPDVRGGECFGPRLIAQGAPVRERLQRRVYDQDLARTLWEVSAAVTGVTYP